MFANYEELTSWLTDSRRRADMSLVMSFLEDIVIEEAACLVDREMKERSRKSKKLQEECLRDAQEHYCEEISELINSARPMSPMTVIAYRRTPKAWAVAGAIRERIEKENE